jgi:glutamate dehydrogenase
VLARLHFIVRVESGTPLPSVDPDELEGRLVEATRSWDEDLVDALRTEVGEEESARLLRAWGRGFPEAYKEDFPARVAVADLRRVLRVCGGAVLELGEGQAPAVAELAVTAGLAVARRLRDAGGCERVIVVQPR